MKYREMPLVTNRVIRLRVVTGAEDDEIMELWRAGKDTHEIAQALTARESHVYNRLSRMRGDAC